MFATTQKSVSMILGVALSAAATFAAPAFAGQALSQNEQAAQAAITGTTGHVSVSVDAPEATLAHNERFAQRAIVDSSESTSNPTAGFGAATLTQNERAAQHSIVAAPYSDVALGAGGAGTRVTSLRAPTEH